MMAVLKMQSAEGNVEGAHGTYQARGSALCTEDHSSPKHLISISDARSLNWLVREQ